jgi:hypothetical protein
VKFFWEFVRNYCGIKGFARRLLLLRWHVAIVLVFYLATHLLVRTALAQTTQSLELTLKELGYSEEELLGPASSANYSFSIPSNWELLDGSYFEIDFDYVVGDEDDFPSATLEVRLNGQILHTETLESLDAESLRVEVLPEQLLQAEEESPISLGLDFIVNDESEQASQASLIVKGSSLLHVAYQEGSWEPDLALYPKPVYQEAFEPGEVRFILPADPSSVELRAAAMIAARLGRLAAARLPISATLASDLSPENLPGEHLFIVGRPDDIPFIQDLDLPISLTERRLSVQTQMPASVKPGDTFSYDLVVENTSDATQSLVVDDRLPVGVEWLDCSGQCEQIEPDVVRWEIGSLDPGDAASTSVILLLDALTPLDTPLEHTASLIDSDGDVLNVATLSAQVGTATRDELVATEDQVSDFFWVHLDQGVAERDGLVQEIVSPSSPGRAAFIVTGLDHEGLLKAAQALSSDTGFLGMSGEYAIVQGAQAVSETSIVSSEDVTIASLGYSNQSVDSRDGEYFDYYFDLPPGWVLSDEASLALHFAHSVALNDLATLVFKLNGVPVGSVQLDETNAYDSWEILPLPDAATRAGSNWTRLQVSGDTEDVRLNADSDGYWLTVYADSFFHLPGEAAGLTLGLENFPEPFTDHPTLEDVVFILPEDPSLTEIEGMLRVAHRLGVVTGGDAFWPQVALGGQPDTQLWTDHHLIVVGRPTNNEYLAAAGDVLPQPFRPGTDEILQEIDQVVFRMPPGVSLGYVQELVSPWNEERAMLAVTGTTDEGVGWALASLTDRELSRLLSGNLALVRDQEVRSMDTRKVAPEVVAAITQRIEASFASSDTLAMAPATAVPPTLTPAPAALEPTAPPPIATPVPELAAPVDGPGRPEWLIPLLIVSALIVVVAIGFAIWQARS